MRIGFLLNHDQIHQVAHSLPIAVALLEQDAPAEIVVAATSERLLEEARRMAGPAAAAMTFVQIGLRRRSSRTLARLGGRVAPMSKLLVYRDNLDFFRTLDVLIVAEKTSLLLKQRYGLDRLKIIHTRHGAGDRAIGFNRQSAVFDHVLVCGDKIRDRLVAEAGVDPTRISVVGYAKFDVCGAPKDRAGDPDERPTVLYNPHPSPHLSSWYAMGRRVLDWFVEHDEYRLIFAPHVMLFERPFVLSIDKLRISRPGRIDDRFLRAPNIEIDLGSRASTTMEYTNRADIYLGDASSQIYEFLREPRPAVFLDAYRRSWRGNPNFAHWTAGPVVNDPADLGTALAWAQSQHHKIYRPIQERLVAYSFDLSSTASSSQRAADAVRRVAGITRADDPSDGGVNGSCARSAQPRSPEAASP